MKSINNKGISLIELLVAIALLAISGTVLFYGFVTSARLHNKTSDLQMAEDVAQQVSEEFRSHSLAWLKTAYSADSPAPGDTSGKVTFTNVAFNYKVNADKGREDAKFYVDVILTPKDTSKSGSEVVRSTTYQQNRKGTSDNFYYDVTDDVGTNTFIMPQITNIYDGKNVVVSNEINQYDNRVAGDLFFVIRSQLEQYNNSRTELTKVNLALFDADYNARFGTLSNMSAYSGTSIKKKTEITVHQQDAATTDKYVYSVKITYTFEFNFPLYNSKVVALGNLNDGMFVGSGATNNLAAVSGADSSLKVYRSGAVYTVIYEKDLTDITGFLGAGTAITGSFGDILNPVKETDALGNKIYMFDYKVRKADGMGVLPEEEVPIANLYILYTPFDLYSSDGNASDEILFKMDRRGGSQNIVRIFLAVQEIQSVADTSKTVTVSNCKIDGLYDASTFKVYTNSTEIINNKATSKIGEDYYLTNAYGKSITNFYDMQIIVKTYDGTEYSKAAELNTVKED